MALSSVAQIDGEVRDGAGQVDGDEDGAYWYILVDGGSTADASNVGIDVWRLQASQLQSSISSHGVYSLRQGVLVLEPL